MDTTQRYTKCLSIFRPVFPHQRVADSRLLIFAVSYVACNLSTEASRLSKSIFPLITNKSAEKRHSNDASFKILMVQPVRSVSFFLCLFETI